MVLEAIEKRGPRPPPRRGPAVLIGASIELPFVEKAVAHSIGQLQHAAIEAHKVAGPVIEQRRMQSVVEVIRPNGIEAVAARLQGGRVANVVFRRLSHQVGGLYGAGVRPQGARDLGQNLVRRGIDELVRGVQAKAVDVVFVGPVQQVLDHEGADAGRAWAIKVDGRTPRCGVHAAQVFVRIEPCVISVWPEMVVDHVQHDGHVRLVSGVHQAAKPIGAAVDCGWGEELSAVVSPVPSPWEGRDGHQFDGREADAAQFRHERGRGIERAFGGERPNVAFVEDKIGKLGGNPRIVGPGESAGIEHFAQAVDAVWLAARARVGVRTLAVDAVAVARAHPGV